MAITQFDFCYCTFKVFKNFLCFYIFFNRPDCTELKVLALRRQLSESFLLNICWQQTVIGSDIPKCVGWERDKDGIQKIQKIDLKSMFDPLQ